MPGDRVECIKCGNKIKELFVTVNNDILCRRCMGFKLKHQNEEIIRGNGEYNLEYSLTLRQQMAADFILEEIKNKRDCVLSAVTGAGKTEIIYPLIKYCVDNGLNIGVIIPRKDVVIELVNRIKRDFKKANVVGVYGGNNKEIYGSIIVATTHQMYRYEKYFDVVVIDEVDAFPFLGNEMLMHFLKRGVRGNIVYMSATVPKFLLKGNYNVHYLNRRYHNNKLDIPRVKYQWGYSSLLWWMKRYTKGILLIYFPTIKMQMKFSKKLRVPHVVINSKIGNRKKILEDLHGSENKVVLSTLVLERGVTFKNSNVLVFNADHKLFAFENLVQISGRVGRHYQFPHGDIIFLIKSKNKTVKRAIKFIKKCNE